jgi:hypothetical protein
MVSRVTFLCLCIWFALGCCSRAPQITVYSRLWSLRFTNLSVIRYFWVESWYGLHWSTLLRCVLEWFALFWCSPSRSLPLVHKVLSIPDCTPFALRIYLSFVKSVSNHGMRKDQAEVTIGVLCYDVYLKDSCYLVFLISYRIDRNGFCFTDFCERFRKNLVAEHSVVSKMYIQTCSFCYRSCPGVWFL